MLKKHIPNVFTLLNLFSGMIAVLMATSGDLLWAAIWVFLGIFFDFFDGFFARKFKVEGELGKQLDSLADMVTSGVVPGIVMFQMMLFALNGSWFMELSTDTGNWKSLQETYHYGLPLIGLAIPLAAAFRLANFNIDERQSHSFVGLPTPAFSILILSLPLIVMFSGNPYVTGLLQNIYVLIAITLLGCYLMNAEISLFSLKFKNYSLKGNEFKYAYLLLTLLMLVTLKSIAIPLSILLYVLLSVVDNRIKKQGAH